MPNIVRLIGGNLVLNGNSYNNDYDRLAQHVRTLNLTDRRDISAPRSEPFWDEILSPKICLVESMTRSMLNSMFGLGTMGGYRRQVPCKQHTTEPVLSSSTTVTVTHSPWFTISSLELCVKNRGHWTERSEHNCQYSMVEDVESPLCNPVESRATIGIGTG